MVYMEISFSDKVVFITGAASGIGRACAHAFAKSGASVVVADFNEEAGIEAVRSLERPAQADHLFVKTDVTSPESVERAVDEAVKKYGKIDVLLNNAGINLPLLLVDAKQPKSKYELDAARFDRMVAVNQKGAFLTAQAVARGMVERKSGVIINMASEAGSEGSEGQSCYAATKSALYALTRSWAKELGRFGVRVVGLSPGILEKTALRSEAYEEALAYCRHMTVEELRSKDNSAIPLKRSGKLSEVADLVLYLASGRASYVNGTIVNISGGKSRA
jgi:sorbitol-6-phosphate 2-dehydrogenase